MESKWISIETLPEIAGYYLVCFKTEYIYACRVVFFSKKANQFSSEHEISHWIELPDAPADGV